MPSLPDPIMTAVSQPAPRRHEAPPHRSALRVAHAIHSGGFYGAEKVVCDLARAQAASGQLPILFAFLDADQADNELAARAEAEGIAVIRLPFRAGLSLSALRRYAAALSESGIRLVHSHGYKPTLFHLLSRLLGFQRLPLLVTAHGYPKSSGNWKASFYRLLDIAMLGVADAVAAVSGEMRDYLSARNPFLKPLTIPNGIPSEVRLSGTRPLARLFAGTADPIIGSAGRLVPMKNHALLIRAYARIRKAQPCRLVILGEGPLRGSLEKLWRDLIPDEPPRILPFQPDVLEWMADMDIFALPSEDGEGLPIALLEAGLLERALVCSTSGGMPEVVKDGVNGRVFPMGDLDALASALADLAARPEDRKRFGSALRRDILAHHDIRATHNAYAEAYARILSRR